MGQSNEFPHQPRHTRWDKVQGKKEKERMIEKAKKQQENLNIRRTKSNTQQSYNSEEKELQREVLELGVKAKAPKELINKRRKISKEVTIPEDVVLVGESREANNTIRKEGRNHGNTWTPLNLKKRKGFNVDNPKERRGENLDPGPRRRKLTIRRIMDEQEQWTKGDDGIVEAAVRHFQNMFRKDTQISNLDALKYIERIISEDDNNNLIVTPTKELKICWRIFSLIEKIQRTSEEHGFQINHYLREANPPANRLANLSHIIEEILVFNSFADLAKNIKRLINMDRWNLPSFSE
ncbi:hypothetical protein RND71_019359 [Anisodus tanguticus]|uniref:Uncharacterized protein n=1 Tax=Anisodus tanguticus TaxID=243964 RepID=A0AAE1S0C7_9SOLA|nr:hypothetical protein RND71_019359 [Anisodus tanguticus]